MVRRRPGGVSSTARRRADFGVSEAGVEPRRRDAVCTRPTPVAGAARPPDRAGQVVFEQAFGAVPSRLTRAQKLASLTFQTLSWSSAVPIALGSAGVEPR